MACFKAAGRKPEELITSYNFKTKLCECFFFFLCLTKINMKHKKEDIC